MGAAVALKLSPQYEVVHFIRGKDRAKSEIATIQSGKVPPRDPDGIGSQNYSQIPQAVVFGRGADPKDIEEIRLACGGESSGLTWLQATPAGVAAMRAVAPDLGDPAVRDTYATKAAEAMKEVLNGLAEKNMLGEGGLYNY
ncbi:hypothetical protein CKM354_001224500 [Cercospora kikuchii]|uniref:Uncharacterized protein n=1 Tax=Cercospora kikuchii TaxID=84275 RepID=A0A9P3L1I6_9PEZI|nr:uncharacterized protein CKM354_001224500 [Cercospora kikuchii]GIZ49210.1 hypothetical protein CKM354_001224500 [Cercospora kikuchii]